MMRTIVSVLIFSVPLVVLTVTAPGAAGDEKTDEKKAAVLLEGEYTIVSAEEDGKATPPERVQGSIVRFTGNKIVGTDKDKKEFYAATFTLDTSKTPWVINMKSTATKEGTAVGLVKKDGETLTIIYALPGAEPPKEFKTKERQHLFVLKSLSAAEKKNKFTKD